MEKAWLFPRGDLKCNLLLTYLETVLLIEADLFEATKVQVALIAFKFSGSNGIHYTASSYNERSENATCRAVTWYAFLSVCNADNTIAIYSLKKELIKCV